MPPIEGVGAIGGGVTGVQQTGYLADAAPVAGGAGATGAGGAGFANALTAAVDNAQAASSESKALSMQAITGDLNDIHQAMLASSRAAVTLELVATVRNKGVEAFNEIMRMQA